MYPRRSKTRTASFVTPTFVPHGDAGNFRGGEISTDSPVARGTRIHHEGSRSEGAVQTGNPQGRQGPKPTELSDSGGTQGSAVRASGIDKIINMA